MYKFEKIKLIIWDLDDTFWNGTISEGEITIPEKHIQLIHNLTDAGIVNSICSKNDFDIAMNRLKENDLDSFFVFPSIEWSSKGGRINRLISDMQLRPVNVLFIDDNPSNLGEAIHFCPEIMAEGPDIIEKLYSDSITAEKKDISHKRLNQYRVLEIKNKEKKSFSNNEEFLYQSNIKVDICKDVSSNVERIHDLVMRSNQLNFTKIRSSVDELNLLFADNTFDCACISVSDKFGDYGIVGFYALKNNNLLHFTFSCRTLGMGIEQYVYNILKRPSLTVSGEVISDLSSTEIPGWINQNKDSKKVEKMNIDVSDKHTVLFKGPCDLFQIYPYIAKTELFDTEFTYTTDRGFTIESTSHTTNMVEALNLSEQRKKLVVEEVPFSDLRMYSNDIFKYNYKVVFISILSDANLGVYRRKDTGERFAFLEYIHPITDKKNWDKLISGEYPTCGYKFSEKDLIEFSEKYEFIGRNTPEQIVQNLSYIKDNLSEDCVLAVMLGGEMYYEKNTFEAYMDRHLVHKNINNAIRTWQKNNSNVRLIDVNKYLVDQNSFYDHFNHYVKPVYYSLASEVVEIINESINSNVKKAPKIKMISIRLKEILAPLYKKIKRIIKK